jgi:hypothetical protein
MNSSYLFIGGTHADLSYHTEIVEGGLASALGGEL